MKKQFYVTCSNPVFTYLNQMRIIHNDQDEINNAFDVYSLLNNKNNIYLVSSDEHNPKYLSIFLFKGMFIKILTLKDHSEFISSCKYFCNLKFKKEYLVSCTFYFNIENEVIIWQILNDNLYQKIKKLTNSLYLDFRIQYLLIFNNKKIQELLIYKSKEYESSIISVNKENISKIINSKEEILYYLEWSNRKKNQNYIIQCCSNKIIIFNPFLNEIIFNQIKNKEFKGNNCSACIIYNKNDTDILCISNEKGKIIFYDLFNKMITSIIYINDNNLRQICEYNNNYLIVVSETGFFLIIDSNLKKIIHKTTSKFLDGLKTAKLIKHNKYGEYLLLSGFIMDLFIYKNRDDGILNNKPEKIKYSGKLEY